MFLYGTSQPSSRGPRWAEGATLGPTPVEPFLKGYQAPSVAQKMPTCLSHQSTQTINHPLPTHAVAMLWGSCSSQSPCQGSGGSCWDPPGLPEFSREVAGYSDSSWASQIGCPCSQPFSLPRLIPRLGEGLLAWGRSHFLQWRQGRGSEFPSDAVKSQVPFILRTSVLKCVQEALVMSGRSAQGMCPHLPEVWTRPWTQVGF